MAKLRDYRKKKDFHPFLYSEAPITAFEHGIIHSRQNVLKYSQECASHVAKLKVLGPFSLLPLLPALCCLPSQC